MACVLACWDISFGPAQGSRAQNKRQGSDGERALSYTNLFVLPGLPPDSESDVRTEFTDLRVKHLLFEITEKF
ncbi:hypothetical protein Ancab_020941 [Ancistrocladus abbreviatus]